jgi:hypothetical protein
LGSRGGRSSISHCSVKAEGALSATLVRGDPALARSARAAADVLLDTAVGSRARGRKRR